MKIILQKLGSVIILLISLQLNAQVVKADTIYSNGQQTLFYARNDAWQTGASSVASKGSFSIGLDWNNNDTGSFFEIGRDNVFPGLTNWVSLFKVQSNGWVGIGKTPTVALDVLGIGKFSGHLMVDGTDLTLGRGGSRPVGSKVNQRAMVHYNNDQLILNFDGDFEGGVIVQGPTVNIDGNTSIGGTGNATLKVRHLNGKSHTSADMGDLYLNYHTNNPVYIGSTTNPANLFTYGNVGVGTTNTFGYKLAVNGIVGAKEVKVENSSPWPDYVFAKSYQLMSLEETKAYIALNQHLPGMPSAAEVEKDGIALGEMNAKLLEKIEELTLYILQQEERIKKLESRNNE